MTDEAGFGVVRIIAAAHGSHGARRGLERAAQVAVAMHAEVVVHVSTAASWPPGAEDPVSASRDGAPVVHDDSWTEPLRRAGIGYRTRLVDGGNPAEQLRSTADEENAFLIVAAEKDRDATFDDEGLGATAVRLAREVGRPLVLVSTATSEDEPPPVVTPASARH